MNDMTAAQVIETLQMKPHPEGGYYCETFRDENQTSTAIYYLLESGDRSHWHRVHGSAEVWHHYAGASLALTISSDGHEKQVFVLGSNLPAGERPQLIVPAGHWQTAESQGDWTLVGCTVAPGFIFENFEMAPPDWQPTPKSDG